MSDPFSREFVYPTEARRIVFGPGTLKHLRREVELLGASRALVLSTPEQSADARRVENLLGENAAGVFAEAVMHVPIETARAARAAADQRKADCIVAIGGGSTTGLAKAIALESTLPIIAIPTTYAGSEVTPIYGLTQGGMKRTGKDPRVLPRTVIYDPELTLGLPALLTTTSAINAIAHAAEGLYAKDSNPVINLFAAEGIRAFAAALPVLRRDPRNLDARSEALYGAWLCGTVLGTVGMSLHHKLCHTLGGSFNLPHAEVHTVILPHAMAYNASAAPLAMTQIARALGARSASEGLYELARTQGAPYALRDIGMQEADLDRAAELAASNPYWNPRPVERSAIRVLLQHAYEGIRPAAVEEAA
jgi:alcohol dehydrogenase class IV